MIELPSGWRRLEGILLLDRPLAAYHRPMLDLRSMLGRVVLLVAVGVLVSCRSHRPVPPVEPALAKSLGLQPPREIEAVDAIATPPQDWPAEPLKSSEKHAHQVWLSPTGDTAYGIIHFTLPGIAAIISVPNDWVLDGYIREMKKDQGDARLISKQRDRELPGTRFIAEGGLYRTFNNLIVSGKHGWVIYAGILRAKPVNDEEFKLAEEAREQTQIKMPE